MSPHYGMAVLPGPAPMVGAGLAVRGKLTYMLLKLIFLTYNQALEVILAELKRLHCGKQIQPI